MVDATRDKHLAADEPGTGIETVLDRATDIDSDATADLYAKFFRGLGDPTRVKIVQLLLERPHNVGELVSILGSPQGRVSSHLSCLRWCGFVESVREGRNVTYRVSDPRVKALMATAQELL